MERLLALKEIPLCVNISLVHSLILNVSLDVRISSPSFHLLPDAAIAIDEKSLQSDYLFSDAPGNTTAFPKDVRQGLTLVDSNWPLLHHS